MLCCVPDHYAGLSETWNNGVIYCSSQTARLIQHMDQLRIKKELIRELPMDTPVKVDGEHWQSCQIPRPSIVSMPVT